MRAGRDGVLPKRSAGLGPALAYDSDPTVRAASPSGAGTSGGHEKQESSADREPRGSE